MQVKTSILYETTNVYPTSTNQFVLGSGLHNTITNGIVYGGYQNLGHWLLVMAVKDLQMKAMTNT